MSLLISFVLAVDEGAGRGDEPDSGVGALLLIGVIAAVLLLVALAVFLLPRLTRRTRGAQGGDQHESGRVGRL